jgi:hypothetical protein
MNSLRAGALYFVLVFAIGFVLGIVRQLIVAPRLGSVTAVMMEAPLMLAASYFLARWLARLLTVEPQVLPRLLMGFTALALLLATEAIASNLLKGWTFDQWVQHFATPDGLISLVLFLLFAAMPVLLVRKPL